MIFVKNIDLQEITVTRMKHYYWLLTLLFYSLVTSVAASPILFKEGTIGLRTDWPISPLNSQLRIQLTDLKYPIMGYFGIGEIRLREFGVLTSYLLNLPLIYLGMNGDVVSRIHIVLPLILSCFFMYLLLSKAYSYPQPIAAIAGLVYGFSPLFFNCVANGFF